LAIATPQNLSGFVTRAGPDLFLDGAPYRFTGVNAYELATLWGVNAGCGAMLEDGRLDRFFASLPQGAMVRMWAMQGGLATNVQTHQLDWSGIDRIVRTAGRYGVKLLLGLGTQGGTCDDNQFQDISWYIGGYRRSTGNVESYWRYVHDIVTRYALSPVVGMWELVSEEDGRRSASAPTCDEAAAAGALRSFFDTVGDEVHRLDPVHLVESGSGGNGDCGMRGADWGYVHASPGVDVASFHDYGHDSTAVTPAIATLISTARSLGKPVIAGEAGIQAANVDGCPNLATRSFWMRSKINGQFAHGLNGFLAWNWSPLPPSNTGCGFDLFDGDPTFAMLSSYLK
jgi:hypothetical protein